MKILFFADLHAHNYGQFATRLESGLNSRFVDCLGVVKQITEVCVRERVDLCFFLGDLFHSRTRVDVDVHAYVYKHMRELSKVVRLVMLVGNHDQHSRVGDIHSMESFREIADVVDSPTVRQYEDLSVALYPYTTDIDTLRDWLIGIQRCDLLLFHQGIQEASLGPLDIHVKAELKLDDYDYSLFRFGVCGHYHKRQFLQDGRLHYVGSPLQLRMDEREESKGFTILDSSDWSLSFELSVAPKFFLFDSEEAFGQRSSDVRIGVDFIRVRCSTDAVAHGIKEEFPSVQTEVTIHSGSARSRISTEQVDTDMRLLRTFIGLNKPKKLDCDRLLTFGLEYLQRGV